MSREASGNPETSRIRRIAEWISESEMTGPDHEFGSSAHHPEIIRLQIEVGRQYLRRHLLADGYNGPPPTAASKAAIDSMPRVTVTEQGAECAICLEGLKVGAEAREMPCRHRFHSVCIESWLGRRGSCPLCRFSMPREHQWNSGRLQS